MEKLEGENCRGGRIEEGELDGSVCDEHFCRSKLSNLTVSSP